VLGIVLLVLGSVAGRVLAGLLIGGLVSALVAGMRRSTAMVVD